MKPLNEYMMDSALDSIYEGVFRNIGAGPERIMNPIMNPRELRN